MGYQWFQGYSYNSPASISIDGYSFDGWYYDEGTWVEPVGGDNDSEYFSAATANAYAKLTPINETLKNESGYESLIYPIAKILDMIFWEYGFCK